MGGAKTKGSGVFVFLWLSARRILGKWPKLHLYQALNLPGPPSEVNPSGLSQRVRDGYALSQDVGRAQRSILRCCHQQCGCPREVGRRAAPWILPRNRSEKLGLVSASCKHRSLNRMLKTSASVHETWRVTREICEKGAIRSSKFGVRGFKNPELRPSNPPPSCPSR